MEQEKGRSAETAPESVERAEAPDLNPEATPEEVSRVIRESEADVTSLKDSGEQLASKAEGDPEAAAPLADIAKQADEALVVLESALLSDQDKNTEKSEGEELLAGYKTALEKVRVLSEKYLTQIENDEQIPLDDKEQEVADNAMELINKYSESNPGEALKVLVDAKIPAEVEKEFTERIYKDVCRSNPLDATTAFESFLKENSSMSEQEIQAVVEDHRGYAKSVRSDYFHGQVEKSIQDGDIISAINSYLDYSADKNIDQYLKNQLNEKIGNKIRDEVKKDLNSGIDFYRSIPDTYDIEGAGGDAIFDGASAEFFGPNGYNKEKIKERNQFLMERLKDVPEVLASAAFSELRWENSSNWSKEESEEILNAILKNGRHQEILGKAYLDRFPKESQDKLKPVLFNEYVKYNQLAILNQFEELHDLFAGLPEDRQNEMIISWLKDKPRDFLRQHDKYPGLFKLNEEQTSVLVSQIIIELPHLLSDVVSKFGEKAFVDAVNNAREARNHSVIVSLTRSSNFELLQKILSPDAFAALQKSTARFVEPFTGSNKDRVRPLLATLAEANKDFYATDTDVETFSSYLDTFGIQPTPRLYEYFSNIQKMQKGEISGLPELQAQSGLDTVEKLKDRLKEMRDKIINGEIPTSDEMTDFDYDILAVETAFHTSVFSRSNKNIREMHRQFEQNVENNKIAPLPPEYSPMGLKVERVKINESGLESCQEEYSRYRTDILEAEKLLKPEGLDAMKKQIAEAVVAEIAVLERSAGQNLNPERLAAQNKRKDGLVSGSEGISRSGSVDEFMKAVLRLENNLGIKKTASFSTPFLRRALFAKTMSEFSGFEQINQSIVESETPTLDGVHFIRDIISNALKEHVLNETEAEKYFNPDFVLSSKEIAKLRKIFPSDKIQQTLDNIEGNLEGKKETIDMVPDRGFAGELAGYYSDACYTRIDNMLEQWPNVIPCKFVRSREGDNTKELVGAVILIESISAEKKPVLIVRANNPRDKYLDTLQAESFCDEVERAAVEYAKKRGIEQVLVASAAGTVSNRGKINNRVAEKVNAGATKVKLMDSLKFNGYEIQDDCILAAEVK